MHVFIAGGTGAIGTRLVPQLVQRGHRVTATTRHPAKAGRLDRWGAHPVVVDGLDGAAVGEAVASAEPGAVVHQMSALAGKLDPKHFDRSFALTNRLRTQGLDNLLRAAQATGVRNIVPAGPTSVPADGSRTRGTHWIWSRPRRSGSR
jgi:nucleoside-diphosphate-sugar epimerase